MPSSEKKSAEPEKNIEKPAASHSTNKDYALFFASTRVEKEFEKCFSRSPSHEAKAIKDGIKSLKHDPRQKSKKLHQFEISASIPIAQHRLRVGNYRVLYDVDDQKKQVLLLKLARRNERTYK